MTARDATFAIPARPKRRYPFEGGVEYEGEVVFELTPEHAATDDATGDAVDQGPSNARLDALLAEVLADGPYRYGDFLELPMTLYLVRDDETGDVFRVVIRDGTVQLHVLPNTESAGLRRFHDRLGDLGPWEWRVDCETRLD